MLGALPHSADEFRRRQGQALEALGYGPRTTPSRSVQSSRTAQLLAYQTPKLGSPAILMVPAPIKKAYISCTQVQRRRALLRGGVASLSRLLETTQSQ
jgi:polyhydroxyalkanoate synthase